MDLPDENGTYVLIASVPQMKRIEVGPVGEFDIVPGSYAYMGALSEPAGSIDPLRYRNLSNQRFQLPFEHFPSIQELRRIKLAKDL